MNKHQAEMIVKDLNPDKRMDLLMYLAEVFDLRVFKPTFEEVTYVLSTGKALGNDLR